MLVKFLGHLVIMRERNLMTGYPCFFTTGLVTPHSTGFHLHLKHSSVGGCVVRGGVGSGDGSEEDNRTFSNS